MTNPPHMEKFKEYYKTLEQMIAESSKEDLAECARLLALNVAHYKSKYGELPLEEHQAMLETQEIDEDLAKLLASGMLEITMTLATVTGRLEEYERHRSPATNPIYRITKPFWTTT